MNSVLVTSQRQTLRPGHRVLHIFIVLTFPILLVLVNARFVMSPAFLYFEYTRPDFPEDYFGFSVEDRLNYAPFAINYLLNGSDITYLGDLTFPDGASLFNTRELRHMRDVKLMTQIAFGGAFGIGLMALVAGYALSRIGHLNQAILQGGIITLSLIAAIVIVAIINWDGFFTGFHSLFFVDGTWYFAYSDTLIRLFPEQFWFDAALVVGGLTTVEAGLIVFLRWYRNRYAVVSSES